MPRVLWIYSWQILNIRAGIREWEGKSGITEVVSYLGYPGLSKRGTSWAGQLGFLFSCFTTDCLIQLGHMLRNTTDLFLKTIFYLCFSVLGLCGSSWAPCCSLQALSCSEWGVLSSCETQILELGLSNCGAWA